MTELLCACILALWSDRSPSGHAAYCVINQRPQLGMCCCIVGVTHASKAAMKKMQANAFQKLGSTIVALAEEEGIRGFYAGILPNMLQVLPNAALSYFAYETFKRLLEVPD